MHRFVGLPSSFSSIWNKVSIKKNINARKQIVKCDCVWKRCVRMTQCNTVWRTVPNRTEILANRICFWRTGIARLGTVHGSWKNRCAYFITEKNGRLVVVGANFSLFRSNKFLTAFYPLICIIYRCHSI